MRLDRWYAPQCDNTPARSCLWGCAKSFDARPWSLDPQLGLVRFFNPLRSPFPIEMTVASCRACLMTVASFRACLGLFLDMGHSPASSRWERTGFLCVCGLFRPELASLSPLFDSVGLICSSLDDSVVSFRLCWPFRPYLASSLVDNTSLFIRHLRFVSWVPDPWRVF